MSVSTLPLGLKKVAVICILRCQEKLLLLLKNKGDHTNLYSPVGGKLEPFETPMQAAIRECFEETKIVVTNFKLCGVLSDTSPTAYNWMSWIFIEDIPFSEPQLCNEGKLEWIDIKNLTKIPMPATDLFIYDYVFKEKPFAFSTQYDEQQKLLEMTECFENKRLV